MFLHLISKVCYKLKFREKIGICEVRRVLLCDALLLRSIIASIKGYTVIYYYRNIKWVFQLIFQHGYILIARIKVDNSIQNGIVLSSISSFFEKFFSWFKLTVNKDIDAFSILTMNTIIKSPLLSVTLHLSTAPSEWLVEGWAIWLNFNCHSSICRLLLPWTRF